MLARRAALALSLSSVLFAVGCSSETDGNVDPGDEIGGETDDVSGTACNPADEALFFHGLSGYGRELTTSKLCVPRIADNGFFGAVAFARADGARIVGGYSAGRLPLVRRLARGEGRETTAVMLDPSYSDGARFEGKTGPSVVGKWLEADEQRRFVLVYSPSSTGWREYAQLADGPLRNQVRVCSVEGGHLELPRKVTAKLFLDPDAWLDERCAQ